MLRTVASLSIVPIFDGEIDLSQQKVALVSSTCWCLLVDTLRNNHIASASIVIRDERGNCIQLIKNPDGTMSMDILPKK